MIGGNYFYLLMVVSPALGVIGTLATQYFASKTQRRTAAGTVETSTASELWTENDRLFKRLEGQVDRLAAEVKRLTEENGRLAAENRALNEQVKLLTLEVAELREKVTPHTNEEGQGA